MESTTSSDTSNSYSWPSSSTNSGNSRFPFSPIRFFNSPVSSLLEYSGILRARPDFHPDAQPLISETTNNSVTFNDNITSTSNTNDNNGEVAIRIIGAGEQDRIGVVQNRGEGDQTGPASEDSTGGFVDDNGNGSSSSGSSNDTNRETSSYQRYDIQQVARWIEQILPFSLLLLMVFIRQHLQGFFISIWITAGLFKSNDILRKQTALKGERKIFVLVGYSFAFILHVIPPFWHAIFIILVNDTMVRQAAMVLKLVLLMYYRNGRGHNFRRQGQMLTLVEYTLLLYRAFLPTPVWYRFFLNKENGSLFSSLTTGLYLTFKLTSIVEKVQFFFAALKALSRKEVNYGSYATSEQVNAAGDLCAICQEKMHVPILLRCKHIFCEDCVSEWFERERTCPLCRALVRPADLRSFGDGSSKCSSTSRPTLQKLLNPVIRNRHSSERGGLVVNAKEKCSDNWKPFLINITGDLGFQLFCAPPITSTTSNKPSSTLTLKLGLARWSMSGARLTDQGHGTVRPVSPVHGGLSQAGRPVCSRPTVMNPFPGPVAVQSAGPLKPSDNTFILLLELRFCMLNVLADLVRWITTLDRGHSSAVYKCCLF
ncbi:RING/U-box superfamily protein [Abeliophyllum distichum]|uniref:RING/U-box superfamily protein n=1 Tax=Abeliophyllum distichum TaxID=126358 RepID=A0ABD1VUM3_9LAMI